MAVTGYTLEDGDTCAFPLFCTDGKVAVYHVQVKQGKMTWVVTYRYREFLQLAEDICHHSTLVDTQTVYHDLPPKSLWPFGDVSTEFLETRLAQLGVFMEACALECSKNGGMLAAFPLVDFLALKSRATILEAETEAEASQGRV